MTSADPIHVIRNVNWNVQVNSYQDALLINDQITELGDVIASVVDEVGREFPIEAPMHIDQLTLELGEIDLPDLGQALRQKFTEVLTQELRNYRITPSLSSTKPYFAEFPTLTSESISKKDLVIQFLKHGHLPWWAEDYDLNKVSYQLMELFLEKGSTFTNQLKNILKEEKVRRRIIYQFDDKVIFRVLALTWGMEPVLMRDQVKALIQLLLAFKVEKAQMKDQVLFALLDKAASKADTVIQALAAFFLEAVANSGSSQTKVAIATAGYFDGSLSSQALIKKLSLSDQKVASKLTELLEEVKKQFKDSDLGKSHKNDSKQYNKKDLNAITNDANDMEMGQPVVLETPPEDLSVFFNKTTVEDENGPLHFFIQNSGLVILWPYLSEFFKSLHLVRNNEFESETARYKAIHLLQFLSHGQRANTEFRLMLNKLLCGVDLETPVPVKSEITEEEAKACVELLEAVIRNWEVLKSTSVSGFRASFLMRNGKLEKASDGWKLLVEHKAYDLLLDKMPWSISIIKLPWMKEPIYVEWN